MKAINLDQPWAELILSGRKTIELRTRRTSHRGLLGIRATKTVLEDVCRSYNLKADELGTAAILGTVEVVEVIQLDEDNWRVLRDKHLVETPAPGRWRYGWCLTNPYRLVKPIPYRGMPGMFDLPDEIADQIVQQMKIID
jgi:hypothetical protein